jgi:hypothetical protein
MYHLLAEPVVTCVEMLHARSGCQRLGHLDASLVVLDFDGPATEQEAGAKGPRAEWTSARTKTM